MSSAKEKAKELMFAMLNAGKGLISEHLAKQCAIIAVEYAEQESILFMNWKEESSFTKRYSSDDDNNGKWYDEYTVPEHRKYYTDKQLYTLYQQEISKL